MPHSSLSDIPRFFRARRVFPRLRLENISVEVMRQLASLDLPNVIQPGDSVAITAGSRGIANIAEILAATVAYLYELQAEPFLVPAMGSHGGATNEGQVAILRDLGVTESTCGCPIRSGMTADMLFEVAVGGTKIPVHCDRFALSADHLLVVGRVKSHTSIHGPIQSGLCKMLTIGLGNQLGAKAMHRAMASLPFRELATDVVPRLAAAAKVRGGLAIVENGYDETAFVEAVRPTEFLEKEPALLLRSMDLAPSLPFDDIDVLVLDEIGKNISGAGLDTNVVGRKYNDNQAVDGERPIVRRIVARSITPASHGNALGVGVTDFITRRLYDAIDHEAMRQNGMTSGHIGAIKVPPVFDTDTDALRAALQSLPLDSPRDAKIVWIRNTLQLSRFACSERCLDSVSDREDITVVGEVAELPLDASGRLSADPFAFKSPEGLSGFTR